MNILRNTLVGALLLIVWGFVFANTIKAVAEETEEPKKEIYLFCGFSEEDFYAIGINPEEYKAIIKHVSWDKPLGGYLLKMPEEYIIIIQHKTGYNSYYINRYNLSYDIVFTINTMGKTIQSGGMCRIATE